LLIIFVPTFFVLVILVIGLFGWFASSTLRVQDARPAATLRVLSATEETLTLPRMEKTASGGYAGIAWQGGDAVIGEITDISEQTVTRRIIKATQPLSAGLLVCWNKFVYRGDPKSALGLAYKEAHIPSQLGELPVWFLPGERTTWVLLVHGFHATREEALRVLPALSGMGFPALVMSYRNDAGAPKSPDRLYHLGDTEWEDVEAGASYALSHGAQDIVLFGWSMGGCIVETFLHRSSYAAYVRATVLDSPILNWQRVLEAQVQNRHLPHWFSYVVEWIVMRRANVNFADLNYERPTGELSIPTLLFHGTADTLVPVVSSDLYAQNAPDLVTYLRVEGAAHTLVWNAGPQAYGDALKTFLKRVSVPESYPSGGSVE
jgi:alpha-beta hydrolase superfamily lysophospholipase